ncbi:FA_desaturase domain-containing protein [Haematococcus lacustris]|uniref:FA_desaturase domain-containing protein n=1 Tax=Haematococcus lacustris TaxID=44745 RepID=A0A699ZKK4_HAELA|nr:FA_desaturase domain-containing protein [Haematococcus lacustris]
MWHQVGQALLLLAWGGLPYFIWGFVIRILVTMHMTWLVNSAVHIWGNQPYASGDNSRNNPLVALLVFGDGWHNNHHAFEYSAAHGLEWWQVDFSYYLICCLERVGLAWDVRRPSLAAMAAKRRPAV